LIERILGIDAVWEFNTLMQQRKLDCECTTLIPAVLREEYIKIRSRTTA